MFFYNKLQLCFIKQLTCHGKCICIHIYSHIHNYMHNWSSDIFWNIVLDKPKMTCSSFFFSCSDDIGTLTELHPQAHHDILWTRKDAINKDLLWVKSKSLPYRKTQMKGWEMGRGNFPLIGLKYLMQVYWDCDILYSGKEPASTGRPWKTRNQGTSYGQTILSI